MLNLAQHWVKLAEQAERNRLSGYHVKAWECMSLAERTKDPERRADLLVFGQLWMSLTEPIQDDLRGAYELPQLAAYSGVGKPPGEETAGRERVELRRALWGI
jgi:hypothetical protein